MPGPLPDPNRRRRNAPTVPTTNLPISGREEPAPSVPTWMSLGDAGEAWWEWAWSTPQACAWGVGAGMESWVCRRASLEDDLASATAAARLQVLREMREMDDRLGLTPKGLAALRWVIIPAKIEAAAKPDGTVTKMSDRRKRLTDAS